MILHEKTAELKKRNHVFYAGAGFLFLSAIVVPSDILTRAPLLADVVDRISAVVPMIDKFAVVTGAPEATRLVLSLLMIVTLLVAVPFTYYQSQIQDFPRTRPLLRTYGWSMSIFLLAPWWIRPGAGTTHRSQFMNLLVSSGPIGLGCFTVALYMLLVFSLMCTAIPFIYLFRSK